MAVHVFIEPGPYRGVARAAVTRRARAMLEALQLENVELSILLTDDAQIKKLNRVYRKKNRPTDVLAFSQREGTLGDPSGGRLLGDVVVSVPTAARQARARGCGLLTEITMLLAHGLLHLLGWDHATLAEDRRMRRETSRLCVAAEAAATPARRRVKPGRSSRSALKTGSRAPANADSGAGKRRRAAR